MDKEIFVKQNWILHDYASVDKCSRPSFLLNNLDSYYSIKDNRLNYSSLLNKSSLEFFNIKSKHQISEKYTNNSQSIDLHEIAEIDEELAKKFI